MTIPPLHVGRGTRRGPLTVFPIWHAGPAGRPVRLADEHTVDVRELRDPQVPHLRVMATGPRLVLLLEGDVLVGGLQDRVSIGSHLLIPGDDVIIDVRCVEPERWDGGDRQIAGTRRATAYVRGETDQHEVWRRVAVERGRDQRRPDVADLLPLPGQSGVLIALGGRPALLEVFAEPDLFTRAWPRLIDAAAREAAGPTRAPPRTAPDTSSAWSTSWCPRSCPGRPQGRPFGAATDRSRSAASATVPGSCTLPSSINRRSPHEHEEAWLAGPGRGGAARVCRG